MGGHDGPLLPDGVVAPILTPFEADLSVSHDRLVAHAQRVLDEGCVGLAVFGTTGEALSVATREREAALEALVAPAPEDPVLAVEKDLADRRLWASVWHDDDHARAVFAAYADRKVQSRSAWERQARASFEQGSREDLLATIEVPTLVLHGTADTLITLGGGRRTAEVIPGAELVVVEGWGHDMAPGAWPQLIDAISTHCHRVDGTN